MKYFSFKCVCGSQFEIEVPRLVDRKQISCPNCEESISDNLLSHISQAAIALDNIYKRQILNATGKQNDWQIDIK